ncbi:PREDICTED: putative gustatory receptor 28b [Vollenhovia emeryi]|uniref:putative gustatory receptor 28b n=1 Tax=Vollenhovia emeryi TaxID=411798 RepID=UPI0005F4AC35|nr:PREDICTED: putative gustatory receptor 28b [Vollenhovia emeryi]
MFNPSLKFQVLKDERKRKRCLLFRATDFASLMYPCFTVCRILGIFSYKFNAVNIKTYKPSYILSTISIFVFSIVYSINLYEMNVRGDKRYKSVGIPRILDFNSYYIFGGVIVISTFILSEPRMRCLQTILGLSLKLPLDSYQNLSRIIHAKDIFFLLYLFVGLYRYLSALQISIVRKLLMLYLSLFVFQMDMLYMNCVCILKACFKQINDNLVNLREVLTNGEPYLLNGASRNQRNPFLLMKITALKKQHLSISDSVRMLKMVYSLQLVSTILMAFTHITFNMYFYFLALVQKSVPLTSVEKQVLYEYFITFIVYYIIKIALMVWACETGKNQAREITTTIYNVFNSTNNKQIKYELELFSLQLLHCENVFSAKWITIDAKLLTAIIGSITTYLLILLQFLFTPHSCSGKST